MWVERFLDEIDGGLEAQLGEMLSRDPGNGGWDVLLSWVLTAEKGDGSSKLHIESSSIWRLRCRAGDDIVSLAEEPGGRAESYRIRSNPARSLETAMSRSYRLCSSSRNGLRCRKRKASAAHPIDIPPKEVEKRITARIARHLNNLVLIELGQRLNALRDRHADIQQSSLDFLWELLKLARDTVAAVKVLKEVPREEQGKAALTELSEALKTDQTPIIVVNIVNRIDEVVRAVRFEGWQTTIRGDQESRRVLRKTL